MFREFFYRFQKKIVNVKSKCENNRKYFNFIQFLQKRRYFIVE